MGAISNFGVPRIDGIRNSSKDPVVESKTRKVDLTACVNFEALLVLMNPS